MTLHLFLHKLIDDFPLGFLVVNSLGKIEYANATSSSLLQRERDVLLKTSVQNILPANEVIKGIKTSAATFCTFESSQGQKLLLFLLPIDSDGNKKRGLILIVEAKYVNQIVQESDQYRELKQESESIINLVGELVTITDGAGIILKVNSACETVMGVKEQEFIGLPVSKLEKQGIITSSSTKKVINEGRKVTLIQTTKSGRRLLVSGHPIYNDEGKLAKVINISKDITEQDLLHKELEETKHLLLQYQQELERVNRRKSNQVVVKSKQMEEIYDLATRVADVESTVLILGESGVGKDVLARTIHSMSSRKEKTFLKINCGAIRENLIESELFGYVKGTFTGANKEGKKGLIASAHQGTLFLDEIGELPLLLQVKLLQVLQEKQFTPVGSATPIHVDVRFVAATNRNLEEMIKEGKFREDLYYRLNVIPITIPSLRERRDEIPFFIQHFLQKFNQKYAKIVSLHNDALEVLVNYQWPGNIRELENAIERLVVTAYEPTISIQHLDKKMTQTVQSMFRTEQKSLKQVIDDFEKNIIQTTLNRCRTMKEASSKLGVDISTISRKIKKYNLAFNEMESQ